MGYSSAEVAREAREALGKALGALQQDVEVPEEVNGIAQNVAKSIGALFEAEYASTEPDGKTCVKSALGTLSQTLALLQDVKTGHAGVQTATESIAEVISILFPLTNKPSVRPESPSSAPARTRPTSDAPDTNRPRSSAKPISVRPSSRPVSGRPRSGGPVSIPTSMLPPPAPIPTGERHRIEANLGATTQSNFYVGFSGEIAHGGVFLATYETLPKDTSVTMLVTLPGGFEFECNGWVRFVRDPLDFLSEAEPGMGIQFEGLSPEARDLVLRFIQKRPPMFYDV
jgi:uncharacterized protein (TIGR02266 family)